MIDSLSLDQLRAFIAAADEGSFSAAARRLYRVQSVISDLIGRLEAQMGVQLFDRLGRYPKLTSAGAILLADARGIVADIDFMRARAKGMASGVEPELSVVIDAMYPIEPVAEAAKAFREKFPGTPLRLFVEILGNAYQLLLDGRASLGIAGAQEIMPPSLTAEAMAGVPMVAVASPDHPLASFEGSIPKAELAKHTQLILADRSSLSEGKQFFVFSQSAWHLADLSAKRAFLLSGLGWGGMPLHIVEADLEAGRLVALAIEDVQEAPVRPIWASYPTAQPPGPAGRWFIDRLKLGPAEGGAVEAPGEGHPSRPRA